MIIGGFKPSRPAHDQPAKPIAVPPPADAKD